jgi:DNA-binding MarR family transcriptional regulator
MTSRQDDAYVDTQSLQDSDTYVYETIATLEYTGRPATRQQIRDAVDMDDGALDQALSGLVDRGLLVRSGGADDPAFAPARRDWSAAPDQTQGM